MNEEEKLIQLIGKLKERNNQSFEFFERLLFQFKEGTDTADARNKLLSCFAITQYAGFTSEEEKLLSEIIEGNLNSDS